MRNVFVALTGLYCLTLAGCGGGASDSGMSSGLPPLPEPDGKAEPGPVSGSERAGKSYDVTIKAADGETIAFTVHEPTQLVGGQKYPLLMNGPGFGGSRISPAQRNLSVPAGIPLADSQTVKPYNDAGYGVISFDQRGFGGSTGTVTIMDPDKDGVNLVQIVDWAESNLDWLAYRDRNLLLGAFGGSYGGGFQLLLNNVDPRHRLDAIIPSITWYDLSYSLSPGGVPKTAYGLGLTAAGFLSSGGEMDPSILSVLQHGLFNNAYSAEDNAMLRYHSNRYFCDGASEPGKRRALQPPKVDALLFQGMYDVVFNYNEGKSNFDCLSRSGGDVRLFTYNVGHVLPSGLGMVSGGASGPADFARCGPWEGSTMSLQWFDAKLKQDPAAIAALGDWPRHCITISSRGEGVALDRVTLGGISAEVAKTPVPLLVPVSLQSIPLYTAAEAGTVVAGIPTATLTLENPLPVPGLPGGLPLGVSTDDAIVYVALARSRYGAPSQLETLGDQITPVRGFGTHTIELAGIGAKLNAGEQIHLLLSAGSLPQYPLLVARNPLLPVLNVSGSVQLPVLGTVPTLE